MREFWRYMNIVYEKLMLALFVMALLIVMYAAYDTWYVFEHADDRSFLKYKPDGTNAAVIEDSPISSDMVGWITVDGTPIDYPVMQGEDNNKYLNLDPFGEYSLSGSIYLDSRNSGDFTDPYSLIYGHHMEYRKMFGALDDFLDKDYLASHRKGQLLVGRDGSVSYELELFYAMITDAKTKEVFDPDKSDDLRQFLKEQGFDRDERIICLSTCADGDSTTRTAVFAYILEK